MWTRKRFDVVLQPNRRIMADDLTETGLEFQEVQAVLQDFRRHLQEVQLISCQRITSRKLFFL